MNARKPARQAKKGATAERPEFRWCRPSAAEIAVFRAGNERVELSYQERGQSAGGYPQGYDVDHNTVRLGCGEAVWMTACEALKAWRMFPDDWTAIEPEGAAIQEGNTLTMLARGYGLWWMSGCRIVYTVAETEPVRRFGFAYGTLETHVEQGEERFLVEMLEDGSVWYDLRAFSRPRFWPVKLMRPLARRLQKRFVRESLDAMFAATNGG
jgi:uncharacterized protein (UPF0548 family)